jgi:hypothetical protein
MNGVEIRKRYRPNEVIAVRSQLLGRNGPTGRNVVSSRDTSRGSDRDTLTFRSFARAAPGNGVT